MRACVRFVLWFFLYLWAFRQVCVLLGLPVYTWTCVSAWAQLHLPCLVGIANLTSTLQQCWDTIRNKIRRKTIRFSVWRGIKLAGLRPPNLPASLGGEGPLRLSARGARPREHEPVMARWCPITHVQTDNWRYARQVYIVVTATMFTFEGRHLCLLALNKINMVAVTTILVLHVGNGRTEHVWLDIMFLALIVHDFQVLQHHKIQFWCFRWTPLARLRGVVSKRNLKDRFKQVSYDPNCIFDSQLIHKSTPGPYLGRILTQIYIAKAK